MNIEQHELQKLSEIRARFQEAASTLGELKVRETVLQNLIKVSTDDFLDIMDEEANFIKELVSKYGEGILNTETGEIKINGE